uniref:Uncharacterized protein n=1 Tax=Arundo donax TaxID=35708 RepID=A0A0A8XPQ4_ARUDO
MRPNKNQQEIIYRLATYSECGLDKAF